MKLKLLLIIMSTLILISSVNAYQCFNLKEGQLNCTHTMCSYCYKDNFITVSPHYCKNIPCVSFVETQNLELNIISPQDNSIQSSRAVFLNLKSSKAVSLFYGSSDTARLIQLAKNISTYNKRLNLKEGQNNITIKVIDSMNNNLTKRIVVLVDTKKPTLQTYTRLTKVNGTFMIKFSEDNLKAIKFYFENETEEISLENCNKIKTYWLCSFFVDLSKYHNQFIKYYFGTEDIAGNNATTSKIKAKVYSPPIFDKMLAFQIQNEELKGGEIENE